MPCYCFCCGINLQSSFADSNSDQQSCDKIVQGNCFTDSNNDSNPRSRQDIDSKSNSNIINAEFLLPENIRCVKFGPSECCKT